MNSFFGSGKREREGERRIKINLLSGLRVERKNSELSVSVSYRTKIQLKNKYKVRWKNQEVFGSECQSFFNSWRRVGI